jgi:hypothetical protein
LNSGLAAAVLAAFRSGQEELNRGNYDAAFAGVADDVVWELGDWVFDGGTLHGRAAAIAWFERMQDAGHWRVMAQDAEDLGGGQVLVHSHGRLEGRTTGIADEMDFFQIVELGPNGVQRVREFKTRDEAIAAIA